MAPVKASPSAMLRLVEDQLDALPGLRVRRMFGGFGLYAGEVFFGVISRERLYFHTSEQSRLAYQKAGSEVFLTPGKKVPLKNYYEVPAAVLDSPSKLVVWAKVAIETVEARGGRK